MNILKLMSLVLLLFFATNVKATQYKFVAGDNSFATNACVLAGSDDKARLRRSKDYSNYTPRDIANTIQCNNMTIASFAKKYQAMNTYSYLNKLTKLSLREYDTNVEIQDVTTAAADTSDVVKVIVVRSAR